MVHTLVAVYDDYNRALGAYHDLLGSEFDHGRVRLAPGEDSAPAEQATGSPADTGTGTEADTSPHSFGAGIRHFFHELFSGEVEPREHAEIYAEAVRRGHYVLTVTADDDERNERAAQIMNRFDPIDIEERAAQWKSRGWSRYDEQAPMMTDQEITVERQFYTQEGKPMPSTQVDRIVSEDGPGTNGTNNVRTYRRDAPAAVASTVKTAEEPRPLEQHPLTAPADTASQTAADTLSGGDEYRQR